MILRTIIIKIENHDLSKFFEFKKQLVEILKVYRNIEFVGYLGAFKVISISGVNYKITCVRHIKLIETKSTNIKLLPSKEKYYKEYIRIIEEYKHRNDL